jgi:hypothetical protein
MRLFTLALSERCALEKQIQETKDVKVLKRAQAFLWLSEGCRCAKSLKDSGSVVRQCMIGFLPTSIDVISRRK